MLLSGTKILGTLLPWDMEGQPSIPLTLGMWGRLRRDVDSGVS